MPLSFNLPQRPSLPTLSWGTASPKVDDNESPDTPTPTSAPPRVSQSSASTTSAFAKRLSGRSIRHTSLVVSRPSTPATTKTSPLSASFGLPVEEEDDPFGVLALEKAGLMIKEAGTNQNHRPGSEAFQYRPSPNSPVWRSSMASAMSKNTRPSLDGRASIMTGRPSFAHSRQSSISEIVALPGAETDSTSLRGMSPVREVAQSRKTSPDQARKVSPGPKRTRVGGTGERPPPLKLQGTNGDRFRNEDPSPRTRMSAVSAKIKEIERQQKAREAQAKEEKEKSQKPVETDLERLAREIREMADEHEEEQRRSEEEDSRKSEESLTRSASRELSTSNENQSKKDADSDHVASEAMSQLSRAGSKRKSKRASMVIAGGNSTSSQAGKQPAVEKDEEPENEDDEDEDEDDDDDYDSFDDEEEPVIIEQAVQTPITLRPRNLGVQSLQARAQVVSIHMPPPPAIPSRNPRRPRNSEIPEEGASTPTSPALPQDDAAVPVRAVASPDSVFTASKTASVYSGRDNDSTSSYSLEPERESLTDVSHDRMSQTSRGSGNVELMESTPTKTKMTEPELPSPSKQSKSRSPRESIDSGLQNEIVVTNAAHDILEEKTEVATALPEAETETKQGKEESNDLKASEVEKPPIPDIPERRRPFSFEASASEETLNAPTIDTTMKQHEVAAVANDAEEEGKTPTKQESQSADKVHPIVIPDLPEDDKSLYEEDFS